MLKASLNAQVNPARQRVSDIGSKAIARIGRYPAFFLSLPSLYLLLVYPPLWKDVDALGQLIWQPGWANILHYPPFYCFTGRIPFWVGDCIRALLTGQPIPAMRLFAEQHPSWLGLEALIIAQHAGLIAALTLLVRTAARTALARGVIVLSCITASSLYAQQQCAGSEAGSVSAIILLSAAGLWVYRKSVLSVPLIGTSSSNSAAWPGDISAGAKTGQNSSVVAWIAYTIALLIAFGTRHINYLLVLWLPLTLADYLLWYLSRRRRLFKPALIGLAIALGCGAFALLADTLTVRTMIVKAGEQYRTDLGFVLIDRVTAFLYKLSDSERAAMVKQLVDEERDPIVQVAIKTEGNLVSSHQKLADTIQTALRQEGVPAATIQTRSDVAVFYASLDYLKTFHPKLIDIILSDFLHGYVREDNGKLSLNRFLANRTAAVMREEDPKSWQSLDQLHSIESQKTASSLVERASSDPFLMLWSPLPTVCLLLVNLGLGVALLRGNLRHVARLSHALLLTGALLYFANCICDYFNDRYALPILVCGIAALAMQIGALIDATLDSAERKRAAPREMALPVLSSK